MNVLATKPLVAGLAAASAGLIFTAGLLVARAGPGGATVNQLSFAGNVHPVPSAGAALSFSFVNATDGTSCAAPAGKPSFDASGNFVAQVDLGGCAGFAFDGANVTYTISIDGVAIGSPQPVTPVPYAKYADTASSAANAADGGALQATLVQLQSQVSALAAEGSQTPSCPTGYTLESGTGTFVVCKGQSDEVVRVGTGATAFWVDRYEASIWSGAGGAGTQYGMSGGSYPGSFPVTGAWAVPLYAASVAGVFPSANMTWFQANAACRASGKRLPSGSEWLSAAQGTPDDSSRCNILQPLNTPVRSAGQGAACVSQWGAQDMVGNAWEVTDEWYAGPGSENNDGPNPTETPWGPAYDNAGTWNIISSAKVGPANSPTSVTVGSPAVGARGGYTDTAAPGVFALHLGVSPAGYDPNIGFRCVIPR